MTGPVCRCQWGWPHHTKKLALHMCFNAHSKHDAQIHPPNPRNMCGYVWSKSQYVSRSRKSIPGPSPHFVRVDRYLVARITHRNGVSRSPGAPGLPPRGAGDTLRCHISSKRNKPCTKADWHGLTDQLEVERWRVGEGLEEGHWTIKLSLGVKDRAI